MNIISIFTHLGGILKTVKDAEQVISDLLTKKDAGPDAKAVIQDLLDLFTGGVISLPGVAATDIEKALSGIIAVL